MTPQIVIKAAEERTTIEQFYEKNQDIPFSRIPVYHQEMNQFSGFVLKDEVMESIIEKRGGSH